LSIVEDPNDNMLVECAVEARADYLISGDAHLKKIKRFRGVKIVSVGEFLKK
jgi:predicted nucleic acid-binding protein